MPCPSLRPATPNAHTPPDASGAIPFFGLPITTSDGRSESAIAIFARDPVADSAMRRSEEHTSELQSLMRISYAVFCLKKKNQQQSHTPKIVAADDDTRSQTSNYRYRTD